MTYRDAYTELADLFAAAYSPSSPITEDTSLTDLGISDSLELVEAIMMVEERWPMLEERLDDLTVHSTLGDIARLVAHV